MAYDASIDTRFSDNLGQTIINLITQTGGMSCTTLWNRGGIAMEWEVIAVKQTTGEQWTIRADTLFNAAVELHKQMDFDII